MRYCSRPLCFEPASVLVHNVWYCDKHKPPYPQVKTVIVNSQRLNEKAKRLSKLIELASGLLKKRT